MGKCNSGINFAPFFLVYVVFALITVGSLLAIALRTLMLTVEGHLLATLGPVPFAFSGFRFTASLADLPRNHPLDVVMKYGVVEVAGIHDSVRIGLTAGEASVKLPRELVGTVRLRARFGDASLDVDGRTIEGTRATLVGAGVDWSGDGVHEVRVDVRYGDIKVSLY